MKITPEEVGYWYFRLNGFLTIPNFVVHPDEASGQNTDIDVIGVRFPYRAELLRNSMQDDAVFTCIHDTPYVIFVEIKSGKCGLNSAMTDSARQNIQRLLQAVGLFPIKQVEEIAAKIYQNGVYTSEEYHVSLFCLGSSRSDELTSRYPDVPQVKWAQVFSFISNRFNDYRSRKRNHIQWDDTGKFLFNLTGQIGDAAKAYEFVSKLWRIMV